MTKKQKNIISSHKEIVANLEKAVNDARINFESETSDMLAGMSPEGTEELRRLIDEASSLFAAAEHNLVHVGEFLRAASEE